MANSHGYFDATTDDQSIHQLWAPWPDANIGIATGNGVCVIDVDPRNGGDQTLAELEKEFGPLPDGPTVTTGQGHHRYFRSTRISPRSTILGSGVDLQSDKKYVVAPPSIHENGRVYQWDRDWTNLEEFPSLPQWVLDLQRPERASRAQIEVATVPKVNRGSLGHMLKRLLSDKDMLPQILPVLGIPKDLKCVSSSRAFRCPVCRNDRHPSASLIEVENGLFVVKLWHDCQKGLTYWPLAAVYAARTMDNFADRMLNGRHLLTKPEFAAWSLRLAVAAKIVEDAGDLPLLFGATKSTMEVYRGFYQTLIAVNVLTDHSSPGVEYGREFAAALTGQSVHTVRMALNWLEDAGFMNRVKQRRARCASRWSLNEGPMTSIGDFDRRQNEISL